MDWFKQTTINNAVMNCIVLKEKVLHSATVLLTKLRTGQDYHFSNNGGVKVQKKLPKIIEVTATGIFTKKENRGFWQASS